jgi:hypothetical protein
VRGGEGQFVSSYKDPFANPTSLEPPMGILSYFLGWSPSRQAPRNVGFEDGKILYFDIEIQPRGI